LATIITTVRVKLVDPSAFTPPYDRALAAALASRGVDVELLTSRFLHGPVPAADGYEATEFFYRRSSERGLEARMRLPFKMAEHLTDMRRLRSALDCDIVHYQWLTVPGIDRHLLPPKRPRVITAHYIPEDDRQLARDGRIYGDMDAVIAHSRKGAGRLVEAGGVPEEKVHVIPHGSLEYLTALPDEAPLPAELEGAEGPVVLFFGLIRPYKGLDLLIEAMADVPGAELWVVGNSRIPDQELSRLRVAAAALPGGDRWVTRFVDDREIPAIMRRADVLVLPYREAEQSGVLYAGLAFGKAIVATAVGGFGEVAADHRALSIVPPGDVEALSSAISRLVSDRSARDELGRRAADAARTAYSWDEIAGQTIELYDSLLEGAGS
jgi:glycosyltransferase involved in cell wall biosynthesis